MDADNNNKKLSGHRSFSIQIKEIMVHQTQDNVPQGHSIATVMREIMCLSVSM